MVRISLNVRGNISKITRLFVFLVKIGQNQRNLCMNLYIGLHPAVYDIHISTNIRCYDTKEKMKVLMGCEFVVKIEGRLQLVV